MKKSRKRMPKFRLCHNCHRKFIPTDRRKNVAQCPYCNERVTSPRSIAQLKRETWILFSEYIRRRDADSAGYCKCITCGEEGPWTVMQAGHFLDGRSKWILFNEQCVHAQCKRCNIILNGNKDAYWVAMLKRYGQDVVEQLVAEKSRTGTWGRDELISLIDCYRHKLDGMV